MMAVRVCFFVARRIADVRDVIFLVGRLIMWVFYAVSRVFDWAARGVEALGIWLEGAR